MFVILPVPTPCEMVDYNSDSSSLFHPFYQKIKNVRSKDYLIKLLKRNLKEKMRQNRKLYDDDTKYQNRIEKTDYGRGKCEKCNCKCRNFGKRCDECGHFETIPTTTPSDSCTRPFVCESEGNFPNPENCQEFYICFHNEKEPFEVVCPKGFAFDSNESKCSTKAARNCRMLEQTNYYSNYDSL